MTMNTLTKSGLSLALLTTIFAVGCGASSGSSDASSEGGVTPYGLTEGDNCFDVTAASMVNDGCMLVVGGLVGMALPVNYVRATATVTVGTDGSLGTGTVTFNMGTLAREGTPMLDTMPTCTWHQSDTSMVTVTATNEFDISVTEVQSDFAPACSAANVPAGGTCTSTWTWHMKKGTKTPPGCM
jgi:hypothetical protein